MSVFWTAAVPDDAAAVIDTLYERMYACRNMARRSDVDSARLLAARLAEAYGGAIETLEETRRKP